MSVDSTVREQRLADGRCPNCAVQLYKISTSARAMPKLFKKRNSGGAGGAPDPAKMTPLTIPGVVERGQCVKCASGHHVEGGKAAIAGTGGITNNLVPTVKAVPVHVSRPAATTAPVSPPPGKKPPPPQSKPVDVDLFNELEPLVADQGNAVIGSNLNKASLKHPPEDLLGLASKPPPPASGNTNDSESSSGSEESESESGSESSSSYEDEESLEDDQLIDLDFERLESDHASSSLVNSLRRQSNVSQGILESSDKIISEEDDRKPAAKPALGDFPPPISMQIEESAARLRKLRLESEALDIAYLESTEGMQVKPKRESDSSELRCPSGMSAEVFYELPPDMQKELMEQDSRSNSNVSKSNSNSDGVGAAGGETLVADIDPETLASLPDNIRKEVLEQARREQQKKSVGAGQSIDKGNIGPHAKKEDREINGLSESTTEFLSVIEICSEDYENLPEDIKNDILKEKTRLSAGSKDARMERIHEAVDKSDYSTDEENELELSGYDREMLASLPDDVRKEVLEDQRRQRERRQQSAKPTSTVGAHAVNNVPAGYDPETFAALPEEMRQELLDDAARQANGGRYSADGYDYDSIVGATVVPARPMRAGGGAATSCTFTGEYNMMGKRHGDGELKWANGDKYVGKFKDGYIEGRGTISFHDGTEYAGQWERNRFHGEGTRRFNNGNVYTGNYVSGKRQGQGKCYFANGDMYVGDWKEDTIHGFGRYYYNNGHSFEGMFRNGKRNGRGKYQLTDGRVEIYRYVNDSRAGDGVRWSANRKKAWRMNDGKVTKRVSIEEAAAIAKRCGPVVEVS